MVLDDIKKKADDTLNTPAVNGEEDNTLPENAPHDLDSLMNDKHASNPSDKDALNQDPGALTGTQQKAQNAIAKAAGEVDGAKKKDKEGSLRIHIDLDLEVEIHLTARVKGDITIGLL